MSTLELDLRSVKGFRVADVRGRVIGRPGHTRFRVGPDSLFALALFGLGIAGLFFVPP